MKVQCPKCGHIQASKSKLKKITCSSCQNKFMPQDINSEPEDEIAKEDKVFTEQIQQEEKAFNKEVKKLKLD